MVESPRQRARDSKVIAGRPVVRQRLVDAPGAPVSPWAQADCWLGSGLPKPVLTFTEFWDYTLLTDLWDYGEARGLVYPPRARPLRFTPAFLFPTLCALIST